MIGVARHSGRAVGTSHAVPRTRPTPHLDTHADHVTAHVMASSHRVLSLLRLLRGVYFCDPLQAAPEATAAGTSRQLLSEFPADVLLDGNTTDYSDSTNKYWLALHALGVIYMFVGLAVGA